jgi:hypothetical protein
MKVVLARMVLAEAKSKLQRTSKPKVLEILKKDG